MIPTTIADSARNSKKYETPDRTVYPDEFPNRKSYVPKIFVGIDAWTQHHVDILIDWALLMWVRSCRLLLVSYKGALGF